MSVQVCNQGTMCHTNHYLSSQLILGNQMAHYSSKVRFHRVSRLVDRQRGPFNFADFLVFSQDRHAVRTIALTPRQHAQKNPTWQPLSCIYPMTHHTVLRMSNPGEPDKIVNFRLERALWAGGFREKIEATSLEGPLD